MILRYWQGWTTPANADAYEQIVSTDVLPGIAARGLDGYRGSYLLRRELGDEVEFATIMRFDSIAAVGERCSHLSWTSRKRRQTPRPEWPTFRTMSSRR
jgi:antibiotic biosynthesis monooxygenase (ABM) superfamily enzyme